MARTARGYCRRERGEGVVEALDRRVAVEAGRLDEDAEVQAGEELALADGHLVGLGQFIARRALHYCS